MENRYINQGFIKLDTMVLDLIADNRLTTLHRYVWYLHYMIGGYNKLIMSTIPMTQRKWLKVNAAKIVSFPQDYIGLTRMGIPSGDRILRLDPDSRVTRIDDNDKSYVPRRLTGNSDLTPYDLQNVEKFRGQGHNGVGYYHENLQKRRFELSVDTKIKEGGVIYMEYVANGCGDMSTETEIYFPAAEMIKQWANYRWSFFKKGANNGETRAQYDQFKSDRQEYKANTSNLTGETIIAALNQTASMAPRW